MARTSKLADQIVNKFGSVVVDLFKKNELVGEKRIVCEKELKGKKVIAFNVSLFVNIASLQVPPVKIADSVQTILDSLKKDKEKWEKLGKPEVCYFRTSLSWKVKDSATGEKKFGGKTYEKFVKLWNESKGSASETAEKFGTNEWGEAYLTAASAKAKAKEIEKALGEKSPLCPAKDETISELTEKVAMDIIAKLDI